MGEFDVLCRHVHLEIDEGFSTSGGRHLAKHGRDGFAQVELGRSWHRRRSAAEGRRLDQRASVFSGRAGRSEDDAADIDIALLEDAVVGEQALKVVADLEERVAFTIQPAEFGGDEFC